MTSTTQLITILGVMLIMNVGIVFFENGMNEINPTHTNNFNISGSPYSAYIKDNNFNLSDQYLPEDEQSEADTSGNLFTDTFNSMKSWFKEKLAPLSFITSMLGQPYGILKDSGLPMEIASAFAMLWYLFTLLVIVSWWGGR
jgi:hypothetical protein